MNKNKFKICKPCYELNYCPYGILVEEFPLPNDITRKEMIEHDELLKKQLSKGIKDPKRRKSVKEMVKNFDPKLYPVKLPSKKILEKEQEESCGVFGHRCPVFFVAEPLTEPGWIEEIEKTEKKKSKKSKTKKKKGGE